MPFIALTLFASCQKETEVSEDPRTDYYYSLKGEKHIAVKVEVYKVLESDQGTCEGYFLKPTSEYFDFIIEVVDGVPAEILNHENLENMSFEVDFEFTGIAYNCTRTFKRIGDQPKGVPVEIQQVKVSRIVENN
jgi:hypothetical protein